MSLTGWRQHGLREGGWDHLEVRCVDDLRGLVECSLAVDILKWNLRLVLVLFTEEEAV